MNQANYVVVGGSRGIGLGIVKRLVVRGASVTVLSRTSDELNFDGVRHVPFDVLNDGVPQDAMPATIDGLAYCPGSINLGPLRGVKADVMLADYQLNVIGAVKCVQAAMAGMKAAQRSSVVMFSTVAVQQGLPMHSVVAASKGALEGLTRTWAAELAPHSRVNCIAPSLTDTPLAERLLSSDEKREAMGKRHPLGRVGTIDDIAAMAEFLLTDASSWVTGQVFGVDGGMSSLRA
ncbi:2-(S)-hydroxypropyl-CoM dehydrogenase [Rubripirellula amarantea]|uniref:2-(S)-hydroxypropyl-CoM dehydrogenase n=1 Tax=Rubripirellula amarantea TaxID=2527999 RepID=A0A5C5WUU0_9BACT|nr:SDR family oxidoreductase [Rubripirellula amarantea]TWT54019.1 2-(S)-hydroxypropyl-CoM dehydrogenase [Rubripirellula amarantea]